jgi:uncharacterized iron-regulated membrane protein
LSSSTVTGQHSLAKAKPKRVTMTGMRALRLLARRLHFMAGVVVAPFLLVLGLTGLVYVFSPQIHEDLYRAQLHVNSATGTPRPVSEQVQAALNAHPEGVLRAVLTPADADHTTRVILSVPGLHGIEDAAQGRTVFVDPYTNFINGELTTVDTRMPANIWLRDLHGNLHLGEPGRLYAELAASWLPVVIGGGLVLWLGQQRRRKRPTVRELLVPSTGGAKEKWMRLRGVHAPLGLWLTIGLLVIGLSGLAMSQFAGGRGDRSTDPLQLHAPALTAAPVPVPAATEPIGIDRALSVAAEAGLSGELLVTAPSAPGAVYTVGRKPASSPLNADSLAIDPYTAVVTERVGWDDYSVGAKITTLSAAFHTGTLFGLANQIIMALLVLGLIVVIVLGYRMWWVKNPYKSKWSVVPPPMWRQLSPLVQIPVLLVLAALIWLMPVLGVSLVLFLVSDAVINAIRRRRPSAPAPRTR